MKMVCKYQGNRYENKNFRDGNMIVYSKEPKEGYQKVQSKITNQIRYAKYIPESELDEKYKVGCMAYYRGSFCYISGTIVEGKILISTDDFMFASQNDFERSDKYCWDKKILFSEVSKLLFVKRWISSPRTGDYDVWLIEEDLESFFGKYIEGEIDYL